MVLPLQITFRDMPQSDAIADLIRERVAKLERYCNVMMSCRVVIQEATRRRHQGNLFCLTLDVTVPGAELATGHGNRGEPHAYEDIRLAIRDAFQAMERQLKTYMAQRRREIKVHPSQPVARVTRLFPQDGYGFITTPEGRDVYFHTNAVINEGWEEIDIGSEVRFAEEMGDNGPQATTVECLRKAG